MKIFVSSAKIRLRFSLIPIIFTMAISLQAEPSTARISIKAVNGHATVSTDGLSFQPLQAGDMAGPDITLKTDSDTTVDLILPDSSTVLRMLPATTLKFARLNKLPAGDQVVTETLLKLISGSVVGSQRKLAVPSHFVIATTKSVATIVGTEYVVNADGAVTVLSGSVSVNYNLPGNNGSVKVDIPAGSTFDPTTQTVVPTSSNFLQNIIADVKTVKQNAKTFKAGGATIVINVNDQFISPTKGNNGVGNGVDPQPPGNPPVNDGSGTSPGNPGNKGGANK